jgi:pimeloyl-ACP methyl ester carboxylesterase
VALLATRAWEDGADPSRPLAVLVHGVTSSSRTWWRVGPALARRGFRVLAVDLRGHGASPRPVAAADLAADVAETVADAAGGAGPPGPGPVARASSASGPRPAAPAAAAAGPAPAVPPVDLLVGHSLGALAALELVTARPGFARRLLLEEPPGPNSVDWVGLADGMEADSRRAVEDPEGLRRDLEAENPRWPPGEAERRVADLADCNATAIAAALRPGVPFDLAGLLAAARLPILLLLADEALGSSLAGVDRKAAMAAVGPEGSGEPHERGGRSPPRAPRPAAPVNRAEGSGEPQGGAPEGRRAARVLPSGHSIHREALEAWLRELDAWLAG